MHGQLKIVLRYKCIVPVGTKSVEDRSKIGVGLMESWLRVNIKGSGWYEAGFGRTVAAWGVPQNNFPLGQ